MLLQMPHARTRIVLFCLLIAELVLVGQQTNAHGPTAPSDRMLARQTIENWQAVLAEDDSWYQPKRKLREMYRDVWSTIDLDEAVRQDSQRNATTIGTLSKLAAAGRWDELVRLSRHYDKPYQMHRFWTRVAEYGLAQRDLTIIELAGTQVEANAVYYEGAVGGPPRPSRDFLGARFYVAAARLEMLREIHGDKYHNDIVRAADDLWRVAGSFTPSRSRLIARPDSMSPHIDYAALESWAPIRSFSFVANDSNPLPDQERLEPLQQMLAATKVGWPVPLPRLEVQAATSWVHRQIHQGRHTVALCYLAHAPGDSPRRASLLAIVAAGLHDKDPQRARTIRDLAQTLIDPALHPEQDEWLRIEASAEIAMAYQAAGMHDRARAITEQTIRDFYSLSVDSEPKGKIDYEAIQALICAVAKTGFTRSEMQPELLRHIDRQGFYGVPKLANPIRVRGIDRLIDLSKLAAPVEPAKNPSLYEKLVKQKSWRAAVAVAQQNAQGNPAWAMHYPTIGVESFRDVGLQETLRWAAKIESPQVRMAVELGAITEAIKSDHKALPNNRTWQTPRLVAPGINGFSDC